MGIAIAGIGLLIALFRFASGVTAVAPTVTQQTVQEMRYIEAILGLVVMGLGVAVHYLIAGPADQSTAAAATPTMRHRRPEPMMQHRRPPDTGFS
jgi:hypothetical protein